MNIPQSAIEPFEPHGFPKLNFIKDMGTITLETILGIMDALDNFIKDSADSCFWASDMFEESQIRALADHLCGWLEERATNAGADTVRAQARAICAIQKTETIEDPDISFHPSSIRKSELIGFMFLVDFTVGDEEVNHLLEHRFENRKVL